MILSSHQSIKSMALQQLRIQVNRHVWKKFNKYLIIAFSSTCFPSKGQGPNPANDPPRVALE